MDLRENLLSMASETLIRNSGRCDSWIWPSGYVLRGAAADCGTLLVMLSVYSSFTEPLLLGLSPVRVLTDTNYTCQGNILTDLLVARGSGVLDAI